jgi:hypothetical protein
VSETRVGFKASWAKKLRRALHGGHIEVIKLIAMFIL